MKKLKLQEAEGEQVFGDVTAEVVNGMIAGAVKKVTEQPDAFKPHTMSDSLATTKIKAYVERVENMNEQKKALAADFNQLLKEIDGDGIDVPTIKAIVKLRDVDNAEHKLAMLKLYHDTLGMNVWPD